ncbi:MAG: response regulator [Rhodanobacter sp.]
MSGDLRAIVIEDDFLLSETLGDALKKVGCVVVAQAASVADGLQIARNTRCDFAVVDLHLKGRMAYPILDVLQERGIPLLMATGLLREEIPARYADTARLSKPYDMHELRGAIDELVRGASSARLA